MIWIQMGALTMALAVGFGAFGAHGLRNHLTPQAMEWWGIAVEYQFIHGIGLILLGSLAPVTHRLKLFRLSGSFFMIGIVLFCGSLYALALSDYRWLGMITPIGGLSFMLAWIVLAWSFKPVNQGRIDV